MAKKNKQGKRRQSRSEFYGYTGNKRGTMDYVFWVLSAVAVLVAVIALLLHVL